MSDFGPTFDFTGILLYYLFVIRPPDGEAGNS
jgi:hypothetical protein